MKFDGIDLFLADPHTGIDASRGDIEALVDKIAANNLAVGSLVAPVWPPVGGGSAMGSDADRERFVEMVRKACRIGQQLRDCGIRQGGVVRIDSATGVEDWAKGSRGQTRRSPRRSGSVRRRRRPWRAARGRGEPVAGWTVEGDGRAARTGRPAPDAGVPSRHGAHIALHAWRQRSRGAQSFRPTFDWDQKEVFHAPRWKTLTARAATLDHRFPRRSERCDGERHGFARQDRAALPRQMIPNGEARYRARCRLLAARREK